MMGISRQTDYAARLLLHLACLAEGVQVSIREISEARDLPVSFIRRLVARLVQAGILFTSRGSGGGVRLARPASEISLLDVVNAMDGGVSLNACVEHPDACGFSDGCSVHRAWASATRALEAQLGAIRFDALAQDQAMVSRSRKHKRSLGHSQRRS